MCEWEATWINCVGERNIEAGRDLSGAEHKIQEIRPTRLNLTGSIGAKFLK